MNFRLINVYMLVFWVFLAVALLFRNGLFPERMLNPARDQQLDLAMYCAFALAAWNLARWLHSRSLARRRDQTEADYLRRTGPVASKDPPEIVNPEFQFDRNQLPPPSPPNGKHR